jgi:PPIC-type PPIASE domain
VAPPTAETKPAGQDDHITVQHILIGFKDAVGFQGNPPGKAAGRSQDDAKKLAYDLLAQAKGGADFDKLMKDNSDDTGPGIYSLANVGVQPTSDQEYPRQQMVPAFGDVGFTLKVGEIAIADYDPAKSPYGYHIIKRIPNPPPPTKPAGQPDHVTLQHILIGFKDAVGFQGNPPGKAATRSQEDAKKLAHDLLAQAQGGADFDKLMKDNSDDTGPGIYTLANTTIEPNQASGEYKRSQMIPAFGDVGFTLKVGEIGIADYDPQNSPFGYHIIKRLPDTATAAGTGTPQAETTATTQVDTTPTP